MFACIPHFQIISIENGVDTNSNFWRLEVEFNWYVLPNLQKSFWFNKFLKLNLHYVIADSHLFSILYCLCRGDNEKLQTLLEKTVPANGEDGNNHTLMHYAAALENVEAVKILAKR